MQVKLVTLAHCSLYASYAASQTEILLTNVKWVRPTFKYKTRAAHLLTQNSPGCRFHKYPKCWYLSHSELTLFVQGRPFPVVRTVKRTIDLLLVPWSSVLGLRLVSCLSCHDFALGMTRLEIPQCWQVWLHACH